MGNQPHYVSDEYILEKLREPENMSRLEDLIASNGTLKIVTPERGKVLEMFVGDVSLSHFYELLQGESKPSPSQKVPSRKELSQLLEDVKKSAQEFLDLPADIAHCSINYEGLFSGNWDLWGIMGGSGFGVAVSCLLAGSFSVFFIPLLFGLGGAAGVTLARRREGWDDDLLGHYVPLNKQIEVRRLPKRKLFNTVAHEYAHHLQKEIVGDRFSDTKLWAEGYAMGFARMLSRRYAVQQQDPQYAVCPLEINLQHLEKAYRWLCKEQGRAAKTFSSWASQVPVEIVEKNPYVLGDTFFYLLEAEEGEGVYKAILQGEQEWK